MDSNISPTVDVNSTEEDSIKKDSTKKDTTEKETTEKDSTEKFSQLHYLTVKKMVDAYEDGLLSYYTPHENEIRFARRFIETKGALRSPIDPKTLSGPTIGEEQQKMMDWLSSPVHGDVEFWDKKEGRPTTFQCQAMFYGLSMVPLNDLVKCWNWKIPEDILV